MNDAFGKIISIWIGCILLFLLPISFYAKEQERMEQLFLITETTYFVDSVRNTGKLTNAMLEEFEKKLSFLSGIYQVEMEYATPIYKKTQEGYQSDLECYYTKQILEQLKQEGAYPFFQGDFFKVSIIEVKQGIGKQMARMFFGIEAAEKRVAAYYGGMIRYEME